MSIKKISFAILSTCLVFLSNCKRREQVPPDPCEGKTLPSANFMLAEKLEVDWFKRDKDFFETDKVFYFQTLHMRGPGGCKTYNWSIGTITNYSTKQNALISFTKPEGLLKVRLITTHEPMRNCFPNDDGIDTAEKWIEVINFSRDTAVNPPFYSPILGSWEGQSTQFGDTTYTVRFFTIDSVKSINPKYQNGEWDVYVNNLLNNGCSSNRSSDFVGYIKWQGLANNKGCVFNYIAYVHPNDSNTITIDYEIDGPPPAYKKIQHTFIGKRK